VYDFESFENRAVSKKFKICFPASILYKIFSIKLLLWWPPSAVSSILYKITLLTPSLRPYFKTAKLSIRFFSQSISIKQEWKKFRITEFSKFDFRDHP
jgi:hypothetical protein